MTTQVRIIECGGKRHVWESTIDTTDLHDAIRRAVFGHFGPGAYFLRDAGLASIGRYGQIARNLSRRHGDGWQAATLTGRVRIDVDVDDGGA